MFAFNARGARRARIGAAGAIEVGIEAGIDTQLET